MKIPISKQKEVVHGTVFQSGSAGRMHYAGPPAMTMTKNQVEIRMAL